ncbi:MAG: tetratricopeptide repeat protein [Candidatus Sumerlaeia bacterium]|nr:tetratricopeptide repeat protein [Candidatus Sumerlaeia bacterium]
MDHHEKILRLEALLEDPAEAADPLTHFLLGREYMGAERFAEATTAFERCVELKPDYSAAWRFLGDALRKQGLLERAREIFTHGKTVAYERGDLQAAKEMEALLHRLTPTTDTP